MVCLLIYLQQCRVQPVAFVCIMISCICSQSSDVSQACNLQLCCAGGRVQQHSAERPQHNFAAIQNLPMTHIPRTTNWAAASPVDMELDEPPVEHLFMLRARSIGSMSPYAPTNTTSSPNSPGGQGHARARHRSAAQQHSSRSGAIRKGMYVTFWCRVLHISFFHLHAVRVHTA